MKLSACIVVYNGYDEALKAAQTVLVSAAALVALTGAALVAAARRVHAS